MDEFVFNWQYKHVASWLRRTLVLQISWQHFWPLPLISDASVGVRHLSSDPLQGEGRYCIAFINNLFLHIINRIELIIRDTRNNRLYIYTGKGCVRQFSSLRGSLKGNERSSRGGWLFLFKVNTDGLIEQTALCILAHILFREAL